MKLIIDIPEERLKSIKRFGIKLNETYMLERALISATPFDSVIEDIKAEIRTELDVPDKDVDYYPGLWKALEIIDKYISAKESEE